MEKQLYKEMYNIEENHWWFVGRRKILCELIKSKVGKIRKILDIGCGTGFNAKWLGKLGDDIYGVEMSDEVIEFAGKQAPYLKILKGEFPNVGISGRFNLITLFDALEHFADDISALKKIHTMLDPGGYVALSVPAFSFLWSEHDELAHHKRRYTERKLKEKLIQSGFSPIMITYFNTFLFLPILFFRFVRKFVGFRGGKTDFFMVPRLFNSFLAKLFGAERFLLRYISFPFGISLFAIAIRSECQN